MAHQQRSRLSDGLTRRNRFVEILKAQEEAAPPIESHAQGLAHLLRQGLAGYNRSKDDRDRTAVADVFRAGSAGEGGYQGGLDAIAAGDFSGNEYAGQYQDHYAPMLEQRRYTEAQADKAFSRQRSLRTPRQRRIITGADGYQYYENGERVLPNAQSPNAAILESLGMVPTNVPTQPGADMYPVGTPVSERPAPVQPGSNAMDIPQHIRAAMELPGADVGKILTDHWLNPPDPVERFEDVRNVHGQGGYGQRSTLTGQLSGYDVPTPSASEAEILRLMEGGMDREIAVGINAGRYAISRHPVTGEVTIVDKANQPPAGNPTPTARTDVETLTTMPPGTDFSSSTGLSGFLKNISNTISDSVGGGLVFPNNERATQAMQNLATNTMITLADGVAGKPSNFLLEEFQRLTSQPNSIFQGEGRTREKLTQTRDMITGAITHNYNVMLSEVTPTIKSKAIENIEKLRQLRDNYDIVIEAFGELDNQNGAGTTSSGIQWRVVE